MLIENFVQKIIANTDYQEMDRVYLFNRLQALVGDGDVEEQASGEDSLLQLVNLAVKRGKIPDDVTSREILADQLAEIRASGFAYECEESTRGIRCIGVPLRKSGKVVAALSVAFPLERYSDAAAASARQALDEARRQIERMLCSVELQF